MFPKLTHILEVEEQTVKKYPKPDYAYWATELLIFIDEIQKEADNDRSYFLRLFNEHDKTITDLRSRVISLELENSRLCEEQRNCEIAEYKYVSVLERQIGLRAIDRLSQLTDTERESVARMPYPKLTRLSNRIRKLILNAISANGAR